MRKFSTFLPNQYNLFIWFNALLMLTGLLFFNWRPVMIVFAYVFETIIIGVIHVFKLWAVYKYGRTQREAPVSKDPRQMSGFALIPFFLVHYFFFIFIQSVFIFSIVGSEIPQVNKNSFDVLGNYLYLLAQPDMLLAFACIAFSNILFSIKNFFMPKRFHDYTTMQLFMQPYLRIFVQQLVSILSGFLLLLTNGAVAVAILLILLRLFLDLYLMAVKNNDGLKEKLYNKFSNNGKEKNFSRKDMETFLD